MPTRRKTREINELPSILLHFGLASCILSRLVFTSHYITLNADWKYSIRTNKMKASGTIRDMTTRSTISQWMGGPILVILSGLVIS